VVVIFKLTPDMPMKIMMDIRSNNYRNHLPKWNPNTCNVYYEDAWLKPNKPYILPLIILKTRTCNWLLKGGGCTMCNYQFYSSFNKPIKDENILNQLRNALKQINPNIHFPYLHVTSSGSFMDHQEINDETLIRILELLNEEGIRLLSTESRPEFLLNEDRLGIIKDNFNGEVTFGMGLEAYDNYIRTYCINKGNTLNDYIMAIKKLKQFNLFFHNYILLGKPFLTPKEDITDAIKSIKFTSENGGASIVMMANHQPHTLLDWLHRTQKYQFPSLWMAIKLLQSLDAVHRNDVWIKGIDKAIPFPLNFAQSCERCTPFIHNALVGWNYTRDISLIDQIAQCCECRTNWDNIYYEKCEIPLQERITSVYEYILTELNLLG